MSAAEAGVELREPEAENHGSRDTYTEQEHEKQRRRAPVRLVLGTLGLVQMTWLGLLLYLAHRLVT